ncbi:uncharacterized protein MAM_07932 [Metarhizium album ARSEF 1941]|uniref:Uncharacterized protein n=1 Tax=Metarhizium album (strain ARSEF 1941) TaxID=1081103 RepID=A0A0B2WMF6_METAS|nr:uncharacterized protein MAM_07932 [Metarhizium album ARSEF 1941]KHN94195.1 hypothetical protein MAM_07932 [Metarhizium album ARSEF 1941]
MPAGSCAQFGSPRRKTGVACLRRPRATWLPAVRFDVPSINYEADIPTVFDDWAFTGALEAADHRPQTEQGETDPFVGLHRDMIAYDVLAFCESPITESPTHLRTVSWWARLQCDTFVSAAIYVAIHGTRCSSPWSSRKMLNAAEGLSAAKVRSTPYTTIISREGERLT